MKKMYTTIFIIVILIIGWIIFIIWNRDVWNWNIWNWDTPNNNINKAKNEIIITYTKAQATPTKIVTLAKPSDLVEDLWIFTEKSPDTITPWASWTYSHRWKALKPWIVAIYLQEVSLDYNEKDISKDYEANYYKIDEKLNIKHISNDNKNFDKLWKIESFSFSTNWKSRYDSLKIQIRHDNKKIFVNLDTFINNKDVSFISEIDKKDLEELKNILKRHSVDKWNGFDKNSKFVFDAKWFSLHIKFDSKAKIYASWYFYFPDWYNDFKKEFDLFVKEIIEKYSPAKWSEIKSDDIIKFSFFEKWKTKSEDIFYSLEINSSKLWLNTIKWENIYDNRQVYIVADDTIHKINSLIKKYKLVKWENEKTNENTSINIYALYNWIDEENAVFYDKPDETLYVNINENDQKDYPNFKKELLEILENSIKNWKEYINN